MRSGWTVDTLKEHVEALLVERDQRYQQRFTDSETATRAALAAAEKAVEKAEAESREWRKGSNEWRGALDDAMNRMMTRTEAQTAIDRNAADVKSVTDRLNTMAGASAGSATATRLFIALGGLIVALLGIAITVLIAHG